jgi:hypothetical protein
MNNNVIVDRQRIVEKGSRYLIDKLSGDAALRTQTTIFCRNNRKISIPYQLKQQR